MVLYWKEKYLAFSKHMHIIMKELHLESPKQSVSSSSVLSSLRHLSHPSQKQPSQRPDLGCSHRSDGERSNRSPSPRPQRKTRKLKIFPGTNSRKGKDTFIHGNSLPSLRVYFYSMLDGSSLPCRLCWVRDYGSRTASTNVPQAS